MRVVVIGGTGVFGERLVRLLVRDGHAVVVAGRGRAAIGRLTAELDVTGLVLDRTGDLAPLWALSPAVVVDAAGPFHAYGSDPYRLARAAIAHGVHYLDLSDTAGFCAGISALDPLARAAGVVVLSGASSVPGLSSVVVSALTADMDAVDTISSAILPGNRAKRGQAVVDSILYQAGTSFLTTVDRVSVPARSWSSPAWFDLGRGVRRQGWVIEVPDQRLFPAFFQARTVTFRAGLELAVMNRGLAALAWLRGKTGFAMRGWMTRAVRWGAVALAPCGTDRGGMSVHVTGQGPDGWISRRWDMVVSRGDGPFVPGIIVRTILRHLPDIRPGAGPALAIVTLPQAEAAMADLAVQVTRAQAVVVPLFQQALGVAFGALPLAVQATHDHAGPRLWSGRAVITRGRGPLARLIAGIFRFPKAGQDVPVTVLKTPQADTEIWERRFGDGLFRSHLRLRHGRMTERFGAMTFVLDLTVRDGALHFPVRSGAFLGLPLPRVLLPQSIAREYESNGLFHFDVALIAPLGGGLIVRYQGSLRAGPPADLHSDTIAV